MKSVTYPLDEYTSLTPRSGRSILLWPSFVNPPPERIDLSDSFLLIVILELLMRLLRVVALSVALGLPTPCQITSASHSSRMVSEPNFANMSGHGLGRHAHEMTVKPAVNFAKVVNYASGGQLAFSVAVGDLNGDGIPDVAVGNGGIAVLIGNGNGTLRSAIEYSGGGSSVQIVDVNNDGRADIVSTNACGDCDEGSVVVLIGNGDGTFQDPVSYPSGGYGPQSVALADLNGDGYADLVVTNLCQIITYCVPGIVSVFLNNGDGTFAPAVIYTSGGDDPISVALADVNGDDIQDIVVANQTGGVGVLLGNGDGTFQAAISYPVGGWDTTSVAVADVNGDGYLDLVTANWCDGTSECKNGSVSVLFGNGNGTFGGLTNYLSGGSHAMSVAIADLNGDGHVDLAVAQCQQHGRNCKNGAAGVLLGNGDGTFQPGVTFSTGLAGDRATGATSIAIADLNGDGRPDLVTSNISGSVGVLLSNLYTKTTLTITSSPNPSQVSQPVTFTATLASNPSIPDGEVVLFFNGKDQLGTGTTTNGVATLTTSFANTGKYVIKANYSGDAYHKPGSGSVKQIVNP